MAANPDPPRLGQSRTADAGSTNATRLVITASSDGIQVDEATHVIREQGRVGGAVFGLLSEGEARRVVSRLGRDDDPTDSGPDTPWAAVAVRRSGGAVEIAATASTMLRSGLFFSFGPGAGNPVLRLATEPGPVVGWLGRSAPLDPEVLRRLAAEDSRLDETPYAGIRRIAGGQTLHWSTQAPGRPRITSWVGSGSWGAPELSGDAAVRRYREVFDSTMVTLMDRAGPLTSFVSGGLDSSFVTSTLAQRTTSDNPVLGLSHAPHPSADLQSIGNWDPDDSPFAQRLLTRYPDTLIIEKLINNELVQPLDAAANAADRAWWPVRNVGNMPWFNQASQLARQRGSTGLFSGGTGNASFSFEHPYAAHHYLKRGNLRAVRQVSRPKRPGSTRRLPTVRAITSNILLSRYRQAVRSKNAASHYAATIGLPAPDVRQPALTTRAQFLDWMAGHSSGNPAFLNTGFQGGLYQLDPFESRAVMEVAAAITPATWHIGSHQRGFAREVGADRVPDEIRLRTRRGGQSWDEWFVMHDQRDRYEAEVDLMESTTALGDFLDVDRLRETMRSLPWGDPRGGLDLKITALNRMLALGYFIRSTEQRLRDLPDNNPGPTNDQPRADARRTTGTTPSG